MHLAIGVGVDGHREILGMWIGINEGLKFWMGILDDRASARSRTS